MLTATCHCGAVRVDIPRKPRRLTSCNCSICHRYGTLWAYFDLADLTVHAAPGATSDYVWGDRKLRFARCNGCGCVMYWAPIAVTEKSRTGVNARNLDPKAIEGVRVRRLDGAKTWKFLD